MKQMIDTATVRDFVLAGNATFTLLNSRNGVHHTYRVESSKRENMWFVSGLTGPDNDSDYTYLGCVFLDDADGTYVARPTRGSKVDVASPLFRGIAWLAERLNSEGPIGGKTGVIEFYHAGRCGRCGRTLTTPESIEKGLGPICAAKSAGI
jgi:hypothetical protein